MAENALRTILLLRHAKSSWGDATLDDFERPLNARGEAAAKAMALHLTSTSIDRIVCSPARRTRATLAPILEAHSDAPSVTFEPNLYETSLGQYLSVLQALPSDVETVLVVGHNPSIAGLCIGLTGNAEPSALERLRLKYPTGTLATLEWSGKHWADLAPNGATLKAVVRPRDLQQDQI